MFVNKLIRKLDDDKNQSKKSFCQGLEPSPTSIFSILRRYFMSITYSLNKTSKDLNFSSNSFTEVSFVILSRSESINGKIGNDSFNLLCVFRLIPQQCDWTNPHGWINDAPKKS